LSQVKLQLEAAKQKYDEMKGQHDAMLAEQNAMAELEEKRAKIRNTDADSQLKAAQRIKVLEDARAQDIENDATETGVFDLIGGSNVAA
jgi:ribosomal protein L9